MAKGETAAERYVRLNKIEATFRTLDVARDEKTSALDMAAASGIDPAQLFKTLIVTTETGALACALVPADCDLNRKALARHLKAKRLDLAPKELAIKTSGYQMGACSPLGQKKQLPTFIDETADLFNTIFVSGGAYGLEMEIAPAALIATTNATLLDLT